MPDDTQLSLTRIDTARLEQLWRRVSALPAKTRVGEDQLGGDDQLAATLDPVLGQPAWLLVSLLEAVLAERGSFTRVEPAASPQANSPAKVEYTIHRHYGSESPSVVWSGGLGSNTGRMTRWAIEDLFRHAISHVLIAGYSFDGAKDLFEPLFERVQQLQAEGLPLPKVRVILDCSRVRVDDPHEDPEHIARKAVDKFKQTCWTDAPIDAEFLYYRPSTERLKPYQAGAPAFAPNSMHAKCIVVDRSITLVGSANFSNRARNNRDNVEVGALIKDHHFIESLLAAWDSLAGQLAKLPPEGSSKTS